MIKKEDLIVGEYYICRARNFEVGKWTGNKFMYMREKFGKWFIDYEDHWDEGPPYGTVKPIKMINGVDVIREYVNR